MDNKKQILFMALAVVAGVIAVAFVGAYITKSIQAQTAQLKEEYEAKQREMVTTLQQQNEQRMALLSQQIEAGRKEQAQQIAALQTKLQQQAANPPKKKKPSLAIKTPAGKRAVTVKIESLSAVGGLLNPGDLVDVIATLNVPSRLTKSSSAGSGDGQDKKENVTAMVFQGLQVLAVNTNLEETGVFYDEQQGAPEIRLTVAVDPDEAGMLIFADKNGKLQLALRAPQETERQMVKASTWKTLADYVLENQGVQITLPDELRGASKAGDDKPVENKPSIQIFRGGKEI